MKYLSFSILLCSCLHLFAQNDSTLLLAPERLLEKDLLPRNIALQQTKMISATRSLEDLEQLPFTVWVVTAEDILRYGFTTLGDVLRAAPGIRVSQPGNALEGETFLMRGLAGNQYVKILINDVPVKSTVAVGMGIGAQLPVRQAERIEVLYGPAGSIYGGEACAGVVNIILKETERPLFTQADLSFGNYGYNSLDLMFGGKLGRDRRIFRFSLYGSSTIYENVNLYHDLNLFDADNYLPFRLDSSLYQLNPNFRANEAGGSQSKLAPTLHESRLFGVNLTWLGMHFTFHRMARFDHSALGMNPLAISYSNPSNRLAEHVETYALGFQRTRRKRVTHTNLSVIRYRLDNTSTSTYVFDRLSAVNYYLREPFAADDSARQALRRTIFQQYASDERYAVARGLDLRLESRMTASLRPNFYLQTGIQVNSGSGAPATTYLNVPVEINLVGTTDPKEVRPFAPAVGSELDANFFAQFEWRGKHLYLVGGSAFNFSANYKLKPLQYNSQSFTPSPRLAALYRIDSSWSVRANISTGFRQPSLYAKSNSYTLLPNFGSVSAGNTQGLEKTEKTYAWELGLRYYTQSAGKVEGIFFYQAVHNLVRPGYLRQDIGIVAPWRYGYENAPGLALATWGIQGLFTSNSYDLNPSRRLERYRLGGHFEFFIQYARGKEWLEMLRTDEVRNAPRWHTQARAFVSINKIELMLSYNHQNSVLSKAVAYPEYYQRRSIQERYPTFNSWDTMVRGYLSNHFLVYFQIQNLFNRHYAGLDATGTPDDLLYNPQQGRRFHLGVNYNMN